MQTPSCAPCNSDTPRDLDACPIYSTTREGTARALTSGTSLQGGLLTVGQVLGEGGFGITYKGVHQTLQKNVAIKELFPANAQRQGSNVLVSPQEQTAYRKAVEDAHQEALRIARFDAPGIVKVFDAFQENDTVYIVMEYLEGQTLMDRIQEQGPLPPETVRRLALTTCEALAAIHQKELLHRDIKPNNLMLTQDGCTVLIDFGSARQYQPDRTSHHTRVLTEDYAAPEQYTQTARFGPPVDVFALGATLFHALTGAPPPRAIERLQNSDLEFQLPEGMGFVLTRAIEQALRLQVEDRLPTAQAFRQLLVNPLVASGSRDTTVRLWNDDLNRQDQSILEGHTGSVITATFSPDGSTLASGAHDGTVRLWKVANGQCQHMPQGHTGSVTAVAFSPDGHTLASGAYDGTIRLWKVADGQCQHMLQGHTDRVDTVAFSPDGHTLASGASDGTVRLWKVADGQCQYMLQGHTHFVNAVAFSPDGSTLASGASDGTVRLWNVADGQCQHMLQGDKWSIYTVAFSPDGHTLASGALDGAVRLWNVADGQCQHKLQEHRDRVNIVTFSPDGHTLASGALDGTVWLWDAADGRGRHSFQGTWPVLNMTFSLH